MSADQPLVPQPTEREFPEFVSIPVRVARNAKLYPDKIVVQCQGEARTWHDFDRRVNKIARTLAGMGIGRGDKIAVLAVNSIEYLETFIGGLRSGACVVPLSTMAASDALEKMLDDCDAKVLFLSDQYRQLVEPYEQKLSKLVPGGRIAYDFERPGWQGFEHWMSQASELAFEQPIHALDDFNIIYSSGTTGLPKGILHSHVMRDMLAVRFTAFDYSPGTISLASTPLYSNTTLVAVLATIGIGGTTILMRKFDVVQFLEIAQRERVTHAMLVPVQYQRILAHPDFDKYDLSAFKAKLSTSAPLRAQVKADCLKRWPGRLIEIYGLTEGGGSCTLEANLYPDKLHTVGKPGLGSEIVVLGEQGQVLPQGEVGELAGRAELMMKGYYKQDDKTRDLLWYDKEGRLYFKSGDMGKIDEDGFVVLLDRKKDMIISGGFNVYAADIEVLLLKNPDIVDAAVIGVPSDQWGESPLALCVRRPGAKVGEGDVKEWANAQLSKTQRLVGVEFRDSLPRSTIGKIMKRELREPYWAGRSARI
ncbi:Acyl-CoA synthetase (AMP-forming)/AMP-acid ligase II [Enhydrobacter aerosaccus]|uniref:Acyl-CoA synthetase (AMP-forming)/AMP-acid ligase II n=1 Tax=Enhydrobacter aerosaccus TaxID=225324 RepID=A0A1T4S418_9HYPH|nr:AMP-binding protein [Enhydrobacter aerosaccus]SKA22561.1 Acyl-CoA synthetase (AMP-forming)/AMP-acid ligase II [Enhydrobacter aerosaccus]